MTINAACTQLLHELADDGLPDVLSTRFTFAALWGDLCRLAGEELPRDVAAVLDQPIGVVPVFPVDRKPSHALTEVYAD